MSLNSARPTPAALKSKEEEGGGGTHPKSSEVSPRAILRLSQRALPPEAEMTFMLRPRATRRSEPLAGATASEGQREESEGASRGQTPGLLNSRDVTRRSNISHKPPEVQAGKRDDSGEPEMSEWLRKGGRALIAYLVMAAVFTPSSVHQVRPRVEAQRKQLQT